MRVLAALFLLAYFIPANGQVQPSKIVTWPGGSLRIFEAPCTDPAVIKHIILQVPPEHHQKFKKSNLIWEGQSYSSCYIVTPNDHVVNLDDKGDFLMPPIPLTMFKDKSI